MKRNEITPQSANTMLHQSSITSEQSKFNSTLQNGFSVNSSTSYISPMNYNLISNTNIVSENGNSINSNQQIKNNLYNNQNINHSISNYSNFNLNPQYSQTQASQPSKFSELSNQTANPKLISNFTPFLQPKQPFITKINSLNSSTKQKKIRKLFSVEEDHLLTRIMYGQPFTTWIAVAAQIPGRTARQCRDRWANYLSPNNKNGPWSQNEDEILAEKHKEYGSQWTIISKFFDGRSENNVKNRWYTHLKHKYYGKNQNNNLISINNLTPNIKGHSNYSNNMSNQYNLPMPNNNNNDNIGSHYYNGDQAISNPQINNMNPNCSVPYYFLKFLDSKLSFELTQSKNSITPCNHPQNNTLYIDPNLKQSNIIQHPGISPMKQTSSEPMIYNQNNNSINFSNNVETSKSTNNLTTKVTPKKPLLPPISSLVS